MKPEKFSLYYVDMKYNRDLANHDENVLSSSPQIGKEHRPYIGILLMINGRNYCVPITSAKPKHKTMPKNFDYFKIFYKEQLISVINFNNMIPVCQAVIKKIDIQTRKNDSPQEKSRKALLAKELDWCQNNSDEIEKNAQKTYDAVTSGKSRFKKLIERSCDFKKLESVLDKWIEKELNKCDEILKATPELKTKLNAAAAKYLKAHNLTPLASSATAEERFEFRLKVLEANPTLMAEYKAADERISPKQAVQTAPKTKHKR